MRTTAAVFAAVLAAAACRQGGESGDDDDDTEADAGAPGEVDASVTPPGPDATPAEGACDPYAARTPTPELLIGPEGLEGKILDYIDAADDEVLVLMYQLALDSFVDAFIAAKQRGVTVRIVLDGNQGVNDDAREALTAAGIEVRDAPAQFDHAHAKVLLIDGDLAIVLSGNLNYFTMNSERNYGVVDRDAEDIADLRAIFEADWSTTNDYPNLTCTRLIVSPVNSRTRLLGLIDGAEETLDMSVMYISDDQVRAAVEARAADGVAVRVLLADPGWIDGNTATAAELAGLGIPVRYMRDYELHAKLVIADGVAFVGSENMSWTSLNKNREVGVLVTEAGPAGQIAARFASDWSAGDAP